MSQWEKSIESAGKVEKQIVKLRHLSNFHTQLEILETPALVGYLGHK